MNKLHQQSIVLEQDDHESDLVHRLILVILVVHMSCNLMTGGGLL